MRRYLSLIEFAEQAGLTLNTMKGYLRKGMLPEPDVQVGRNRGWDPKTAADWIAERRERHANRPH
ncbi:transcriptional regulator [Gordonia amicalis]|uniref:transcriptional regulator n=1 Tax=Gordonia amicalis TaxID=89053 RepID=UPI00294AF53F|nr:transcriptional regulator [Gordonia amicalis]